MSKMFKRCYNQRLAFLLFGIKLKSYKQIQKEVMKYNTCNVIDLESTCWPESNQGKSEIIEIGIVSVDMNRYEINDKKSIYVKPENSTISEYCTTLTGITQKTIDEKGITLSQAFDILRLEYDSLNRPWISFGDYDRDMIYHESNIKKLQYPLYKRHINIKFLTTILEGFNKEPSLGRTLQKLKMEFIGSPHCGSDDAYNTAKLLIYLLKKYKNIPLNK